MKKILLSLLMLLSTAAISQAQGHKIINFGVKAGVNLNSVTGFNDIVNAVETGFTGGIFFELRPIKWFGISVDALYSMSGFKLEPIQVDNWSARTNVDLGYIDLPIMVKFYVLGGLSINAGVMPSFLVNSNVEVGGKNSADVGFNSTNFSIPVGLSYQFRFGLALEARYNIGISDINKGELTSDPNSDPHSLRNQAFSFMVGWRF